MDVLRCSRYVWSSDLTYTLCHGKPYLGWSYQRGTGFTALFLSVLLVERAVKKALETALETAEPQKKSWLKVSKASAVLPSIHPNDILQLKKNKSMH